VKSKKECLPSFVFALFFDFQESVSSKSKTLRKDATDAQMNAGRAFARQRAKSAGHSLSVKNI
jgi:hypothetical protein